MYCSVHDTDSEELADQADSDRCLKPYCHLYILHYFRQSYEGEQYFRESGLLLAIHSRIDLAKL